MKMLLPALAVLSSTAMAADFKWNVEGRFDYGMSKVKHENTTAGQSYDDKRSEFSSGVLRLNSVFTINETLSGRFRYRLSTKQDTANRDLSLTNTDFFYVDHKNQWFTTRIGKHNQVESLGREYFMSGTDYPVTAGTPAAGTSLAYTSLNSAVYNAVKGDADLYHVGVSAIYTGLQGHTFTLSAFNPQKTTVSDTQGAGDNAKNVKTAMGAYYNGSFLDGLVQPTLGYTSFGIDAGTGLQTNVAATHKLMAAGVRSSVAGFVIDADWKQYKKDNIIANATAASTSADKTTSIWANVAYTWDMLTPSVNYIHDKYDAEKTTTADWKRDAYSVALAIKPNKDVNFRYHVGYTQETKKNENNSTETKIKSNMMFAGIKFDL